MERLRRVTVVGIVVGALLAAAAAAAGADPADVVPQDTILYVEADRELSQGLVGAMALPPVAGLFMPGGVGTPFGHVAGVLKLPAGAVDEAAPHLMRVVLALSRNGPLVVLEFDGPEWPAALVQGLEVAEDGSRTLVDGELTAAAQGALLTIGDPRLVVPAAAGGPGLTGNAAFAEARLAAREAGAWAYVAAGQLTDFLRTELRGNDALVADAFIAAAGIDGSRYGLVTLRGAEDGGTVEATVVFEDESAPVLQLLPQGQAGTSVGAPAGAPAALALHWGDASAAYSVVVGMLTQMDITVLNGQVQAGIDQMEMMLGIGLDELFATVGAGAVAYLPQPTPGALMRKEEWTAAVSLKDAAEFERLLGTVLANTVGAGLIPETHEGVEVKRTGMLPVVCKISDGSAVFGGSAEAVRKHLDAAADPQPAAHALSFQADLGLLLSSYPAPEPGAKVGVRLWREANAIRLTAAATDMDMAQFGRRGIAAYPALMAAMLMPALSRARGEARKSSSKANLHNIGLAIMMYQADHDGEFPPDLEELVDLGYLMDATPLRDPADQTPDLTEKIQFEISYIYAGPLPRNVPAPVIVCYSREGIYPGGRNVLYVDCAVEFVTEADLADPFGNVRTSLRMGYDAVVEAFGDDLTPERDAELRRFYEIDE